MAEEHRMQVELMARLRALRPEIEAEIFAIPNGGLRHPRVASQLKAEGLKSGVPDLCLPVPRAPAHGLFVEMKTASGRLSASQRDWVARLTGNGYTVAVCYSVADAFEVITGYFDDG